MLAEGQTAIPDLYVGDDGLLRIVFTIEAGQLENVYLANQLLLEDAFVQTASLEALKMHGEQYGEPMEVGTASTGSLLFDGDGATYIPIGAEVAYDPGGGLDEIFFETTLDGTIPNPGVPTPPTAAINAVAGNLNGSYEYAVTFVTAEGETLQSLDSISINPINQQAALSAIPIGGPGTIARRIYRQKNGTGDYRRIFEIADNTTTTLNENVSDAVWATSPTAPTVDTAHRITLTAKSQDVGVDKNVAASTIAILSNAPGTLVSVINPTPFVGGSDPEDSNDYRTRLLTRIQNPQTGSALDLKQWAEEISGVETATVFSNDNLGTPQAGHATVRISGPGGIIPSGAVQSEVFDSLVVRDIANVTLHVGTYTAVPTNVTVTLTLDTNFIAAEVQASVAQAITDYINALEVGETLRVAGIVDAVFGLPGVLDVVVNTPATNQTTTATQKRTPGTITVN